MARKRLNVIDDNVIALPTRNAVEDRHFVNALARGLEVLACFRKGETLLGNQEIAERCKLPKSTVSRLTYTLTKLGYLHYVESVAKYRLGTAVLALGTSMLARLDVRNVARPQMEDLAVFARASVGLGARDRLSMVYVECVRGHATISLTIDVGSRISVSTSAMGRAFLAVCTEEERAPILDEIRALDQVNWPKTRDAIAKAVSDYQTLGCTCSFGDWHETVNAIAVGFRPGGGLPPMALNCGAPSMIVKPEFLLTEVRPRLITLAKRLDGSMGT
jgi:DNA-binding IclR family transcriptional regulator